MESKLSQQKNVMTSKIKPKPKISSSEKQNTWSNLLNKKSTSTNTVLESKNKSKKHSPIFNKNNKTTSKGVQCDSIPINYDTKLCKNVDQISVFNPIRTLQFLLKEIKGLNIQDKSVKKIVDDMQIVVERIINEQLLENILFSKSHMPVTNENSMIPTRDNDNLKNLNCENNQLDNKYWLVLLRKISELENNYSQLTKNYTNSEEKLLCITSERNKLLEKFKESCDSLEELNNRERAYLDTIAELKTKLITSEKLISKQESIIINLNTKLNISQKKKEVIFTDLQNNEFNTNYNNTKLEINRIKDNEISKFRSDMRQMKKIVMTGLENNNNKFMSMKPESNSMKDFSKYSETRKIEDIDTQFIEFNKQASAIKSAKTELQQLFETIKTQTNLSKKQFNSTIINYETNINDIISDEEDNYSNLSNFTSIITDSSN